MFDWLSSQAKPRRTERDEPAPVHPTSKEHDEDHAHQHYQPKNPFKEAEDFVSNWFQGFSSSGGRSNDRHENEHVPHPSAHDEDDQADHILSRTTHTPTPPTSINVDAVPETLTPLSMSLLLPDDDKKEQGQDETGAPSASSPTELVAAAPATKIHSGHVAWFDTNKGYGFLLVDNEVEGQDSHGVQDDIFVHYSAISIDTAATNNELTLFRKLVRNEPVEFQLITTAGGKKKAVHVTGPDGTPVQYIREQLIRRTVVPSPADATTQDNNNGNNNANHRNE